MVSISRSMKRRSSLSALAVLAFGLTASQSSFALPRLAPAEQPFVGFASDPAAELASLLDDVENYQIGDVWGKEPISAARLAQESPAFQSMARATARVYSGFGGATGFYLGKFNGQHVMATNYHVTDAIPCESAKINFPFLNKRVSCKKLIGNWTDVDLGLMVLDVAAADEAAFEGVGKNFKFDATIYPGEELLTVGFGVAKNAGQRNMMANQDNDCKVYSGLNDFRLMGDPDTINPGPYKAWSFANGCDISHGDSGSAFVDRKTGDVIGIVWTAATPKVPEVRTRAFLDGLTTQSPEVWTRLSYTVPAPKIGEFLSSLVSEGKLEAEDVPTVRGILGQN